MDHNKFRMERLVIDLLMNHFLQAAGKHLKPQMYFPGPTKRPRRCLNGPLKPCSWVGQREKRGRAPRATLNFSHELTKEGRKSPRGPIGVA